MLYPAAMGTWNEDSLAAQRTTAAGAAPVSKTTTRTAVVLTANTAAVALAANPNRLGATIYNGTGAAVLLNIGGTASATEFTISLVAGGYYEVPFRSAAAISAFSTAASAAPHLLVTEFTA